MSVRPIQPWEREINTRTLDEHYDSIRQAGGDDSPVGDDWMFYAYESALQLAIEALREVRAHPEWCEHAGKGCVNAMSGRAEAALRALGALPEEEQG